MRNWIYRHPVRSLVLYTCLYLSFFFALEHNVTVPRLLMHCRLDDVIPFCKYAIVPYCLWFLWIGATLAYFMLRAPRSEYWRLCWPLGAGMMLSLLFCALVPNGLQLRPPYVPGNDIFAVLVRRLYLTDTATNVFPSIHVFNSVTLDMAYQRSSCFAASGKRWVRTAAHVLDIAIILSTVLLKQHSVLDVVGGLVLAFGLEAFTARLYREPRRARLAGLPENS